jgi:hypothetical protein
LFILILAVVAMLYKTFYYDYQKREIPAEVNASIETPEVSQPESQPVKTVEPTKNNTVETGWQSRKGMPIDRLGDSIGDSLKEKIKVK